MADEVRYVPATRPESWRVALSPGTIVALPPNVSVPTVEAVWRRLGERGIGAVIEALTGAFGTSLAAIPDFLLATVEPDGVRVAVRGPVELVVETADGAEAISGAGVATWVERYVAGATRVSAGLASSADEGAALPIVEGVVAVDAMTLTRGGGRVGPARARAAAPVQPAAPAAESAAPSSPRPVVDAQPDASDASDASDAPDAPDAPDADARPDEVQQAGARPDEVQQAGAHSEADAAAEDQIAVWGDTIARVAPAAEVPAPLEPGITTKAPVDDEPPTPAPAAPDATIVSGPRATAAPAGDHDGQTVASADIRALRRGAQAETAAFEATATVSARQLARGRIRVSDGQVVELERTVIVGRRPRSPRAAGDTLPTLVAVASPQQDISRNHVEIRAEGEHVLAVDLDTTNGTVLLRGGADPVRLHPNEPTMVVSGDILDLGDGVTIELEDLP